MTKCLIIFFLCITSGLSQEYSIDDNIERKIERRVTKLFDNATTIDRINYIPNGFYNKNKTVQSFYRIVKSTENVGHVIHGMTHVCYFGGCTTFTDQSKKANREELEYLIYFNSSQQIMYIDIIDFESNYGYEISAKWWLKQFLNKRPGHFKLGENIDGISGATVSCENFVEAVNELIDQE